MTRMFFHSLPPPAPVSGGADGLLARVLGALVWLMLAALGAVFALSLLIWLVVMVVVSLVGSLFTGRPATVTLLWRRYPSAQTSVQDVSWREVPAAPAADGDAPGR